MLKKSQLIFLIFLLLIGSSAASTVSRSFSNTSVEAGVDVIVTLTVDITGSETYYAVDETIQTGWAISDAGTGTTDEAGHIKWIVIENAIDTSYFYTLTAPSSEETSSFSGIYMFEGMDGETQITGETQVTVTLATCSTDDDCPGQICCNSVCGIASCTLDSECDDSDACTTDTCSNGGTCTATCVNTAIADCRGAPAIGPSDPGSPGGGTSGAKLIVNIQSICVGQPITVNVLNESGNPSKDAEVLITKDGTTIEITKTSETGILSFTFEETGEYTFYVTKTNHEAYNKKIQLLDCSSLQVTFESEIKTGQEQVVMLLLGDGTPVEDFNLLLIYPDNTTKLILAKNGIAKQEIEQPGKYRATVQSIDYEISIVFEATTPHQIVPNINPDAEPVVETVLGGETIQQPNFLIIWILAVAIISGLIIEVTKMKPGWFRVFMAITYATLPFVVNYYTKNIFVAFVIIVLQTIILTALYFNQWRIKKALQAMKKIETNE